MSALIGTYILGAELFDPSYVRIQLTNLSRDSSTPLYGDSIQVKVTEISYQASVLSGRNPDRFTGLYLEEEGGDSTSAGTLVKTITSSNLSVGNTFTFSLPNLPIDNINASHTYKIRTIMHYAKYSIWAESNHFTYCSLTSYLSFDYKPVVTISNPIVYTRAFHNYPVAGISTLSFVGNITHNIQSDTAELSIEGRCTNASVSELSHSGNDHTFVTGILNASNAGYTTSVSVVGRDSRGRFASASKNISVKGYYLPRLIINTSGDSTYTSRCNQEGLPDGLGEYGKLHLVWDISPVDEDDPNTLQVVEVVLNEETILTPSAGSIQDGYYDYIFPLPTSVQGNLEITLIDEIEDNVITSQVVPKAVMPMSLYDDGAHVGVAYGRMATQEGIWMYLPLYLKSFESAKVFQIKVDDGGNLFAEGIGPSPSQGHFWVLNDSVTIDSMSIDTPQASAGEQIIIDTIYAQGCGQIVGAYGVTSVTAILGSTIYLLSSISVSNTAITDGFKTTVSPSVSGNLVEVKNKYLLFLALGNKSPSVTNINVELQEDEILFYISGLVEGEVIARGPGVVQVSLLRDASKGYVYIGKIVNNYTDKKTFVLDKSCNVINEFIGYQTTATAISLDGTAVFLCCVNITIFASMLKKNMNMKVNIS